MSLFKSIWVFAITAVPFLLPSTVTACNDINDVTITFYGYPDNSPPGAGTAYDCGGRNYVAGGTGTYDDPLTFATAPGEFDVCEILYLPYLKKYVRMEDSCAQCTSDWQSGQYHIDIWTGSSTSNGGDAQMNCEDDLTPDSQSVVQAPSSSYEVDSTALFENGQCNTQDTYNGNSASNYC